MSAANEQRFVEDGGRPRSRRAVREASRTRGERRSVPLQAPAARHEGSRSGARRGRELLLKLHRYVALLAGAMIMAASLSGSLLVFRDELSGRGPNALPAEAGAGQRQPIGVLLEAAAALEAGSEVERVRFPDEDGAPLEVVARKPDRSLLVVSVDQRTGATFAARGPDVFERLLEFHNLLFLDSALDANVSRYVVGGIGLLMIVMSLSGLCLWWPRGTGARQSAFRINFAASWKRTNWDLHRVGGAVSAALILVVSASGVFVALAEPVIHGAGPAPAAVAPSATSPAARAAVVDEMVERAREALPQARLRELRLAAPGGVVVAVLEERDARGELLATPRVSLDPRDGAVLSVTGAAAQLGELSALDSTMKSIHRGQALGAPGRLLVFVTGLAPVFLGVSGFLIWRNKQKKSRRSVGGRSPRAQAESIAEATSSGR